MSKAEDYLRHLYELERDYRNVYLSTPENSPNYKFNKQAYIEQRIAYAAAAHMLKLVTEDLNDL